jgi:signal transduction histidine kinase
VRKEHPKSRNGNAAFTPTSGKPARPLNGRREGVAALKTAELERASAAMQKAIDAMASMKTLSDFVPKMLQIVAEAFGVESAGYFEHPDGTIYLRHWIYKNRIYGPEDLPGVDPVQFGVIRTLAAGFTVSYEHLGADARHRSLPSIINHNTATATPAFHAFASSLGWDWELNVPLLVNGVSDGALVLFRPASRPFTENDFSLAGTLAKQMALAMQADKIANREREVLLAAAAEAAQFLLKADDLTAALPEAFRILGTAANMDRLLLLVEFQDASGVPIHRVQAEWATAGGTGHAELERADQADASFTGLVQKLEEGQSFWLHRNSVNDADREVFSRLGMITAIGYPIYIGDEYVGVLVFGDCSKNRVFTVRESETLRMVASLISAALQRHRLIDTLAQEREKATREQANELVKANRALRRSADSLVSASRPEEILKVFLRETTSVSGASAGAVLRRVGEGAEFGFVAIIQDGRVIDQEALGNSSFEKAVRDDSRSDLHGYFAPLLRGEVCWRLIAENHLPEAREYHASQGQKALWEVPFRVNGRVEGYLGLAFRTVERPRPVVAETIGALADQIALAMQFTRLADAAKESAILQEKEKAAREREAEIAQSNLALRQSIARLAGRHDINGFIEDILRDAAAQVGAPYICLFLVDDDAGTKSLFKVVGDRKSIDWAAHPQYELWRRPVPLSRDCQAKLKKGDGKEFWITFSSRNTDLPAEEIAFHRRLHHASRLSMPLQVGDRPVALMELCFSSPEQAKAKGLEIIRALGQQMALALQLVRLGREAEQTAILEERARIAGEIHDSLAQSFAAISLQTEIAEEKLLGTSSPALDAVAKARELARFGLSEARRSVLTLRPSHVLQLGLHHAVQQLAQRTRVPGAIECAVRVEGQPKRLDSALEHQAFRIIQEAVNNAVRHAKPSRIKISLHFKRSKLSVKIEDNGIGMGRNSSKTSEGFGLFTMRERTEKFGGTFETSSRRGKGTKVTANFPSLPAKESREQ